MTSKRRKLSTFCKTGSGSTPNRSKAVEYYGGAIPWVKSGELRETEILSTEETVTDKALKETAIKMVPKGALLIAMYGATVGRMAFLGLDATTNQAVCHIIPDAKECETRYLFYSLQNMIPQILDKRVGGGQPNISQQIIKDLEIPLPPLAEQKRIAAILNKADAIRRKRQAVIKLADDFLHATFLNMFGDPITNFKGWEVKKLKEISTNILSGSTPKGGKQVYVREGVVFLRSQNVWRNRLPLDDVAYIDNETHLKMKKSSLKNKDILMTKTGRINTENSSLGRAAMFLGQNNSANINGHVYLIRLQKAIIHEYVLYILTTDEYREYIRRVCVGGIDKRQINKEHLEEFPIIFPPLDLQHRFATIVESVGQQKARLREHLAEVDTLSASLTQRAFRGEL